LGLPHVELDAIFHQANWTQLSPEEFRERMEPVGAEDRWVVDGNYAAVQDMVWARADTVVWLDLPRLLVMRRVIARSIRRLVTRQELWNGNREPLANFFPWTSPERSVIRWAWIMHAPYEQRYESAITDPRHGHLRFVRLRSPRSVEEWLGELRPEEPVDQP
jgi:adenylate kinase family enzyme